MGGSPDAGTPEGPHPRVLTPREWRAYKPPLHLSDREWQVMIAVGHGLTNPQIAHLLGIGTQTVKNHVGTALAKLGAHNRIEGLIALGWIEVPER